MRRCSPFVSQSIRFCHKNVVREEIEQEFLRFFDRHRGDITIMYFDLAVAGAAEITAMATFKVIEPEDTLQDLGHR